MTSEYVLSVYVLSVYVLRVYVLRVYLSLSLLLEPDKMNSAHSSGVNFARRMLAWLSRSY